MTPSPPSRGGTLIGTLPDFALAGVALQTWVRPDLLGPRLVRWFLMLMLVEFVVLHSAVLMGRVAFSDRPRPVRVRATVGLGAFYTLLLLGVALGFRTWWPLATFWLLILNRLLGILLGQAPTGQERAFLQRGWGAGVTFYLVGSAVVTLLPIPALGIERSMTGELADGTGGLWVDEPQRAVVFAMLYFAAVGISGLYGHGWARNRNAP